MGCPFFLSLTSLRFILYLTELSQVHNKHVLKRLSSALLPFQLPKDMQAVEEHCEDRPRDITPYRDADNNVYEFAFGLNWSGVIEDERTERYR